MWQSTPKLSQRFNDWLGYGALGPILILLGLGGIGYAFYSAGSHPAAITDSSGSSSRELSVMALKVSGVFTAGVGVGFTLRPRTPWWLAIVGSAPTVVANLALNYLVYGMPAWFVYLVLWLSILTGTTWYAHHCHRPVYGQPAR